MFRDAQQRKGEYSPFKSVNLASAICSRLTLNKGRGNIPPSSGIAGDGWVLVGIAQQRKGEYSPFKVRMVVHDEFVLSRSTKEGGIFPLQAVVEILNLEQDDERSTKEGGIFPLQDAPHTPAATPLRTAQQRKGEYSPFKSPACPSRTTAPRAQQRKGEYSPFKPLA